MQRIIEEAEYVLSLLRQTRDHVAENPTLFAADALKRIDEAIAHTENVIRCTRAQLESMRPRVKAA